MQNRSRIYYQFNINILLEDQISGILQYCDLAQVLLVASAERTLSLAAYIGSLVCFMPIQFMVSSLLIQSVTSMSSNVIIVSEVWYIRASLVMSSLTAGAQVALKQAIYGLLVCTLYESKAPIDVIATILIRGIWFKSTVR